jgi:hypothetical protein
MAEQEITLKLDIATAKTLCEDLQNCIATQPIIVVREKLYNLLHRQVNQPLLDPHFRLEVVEGAVGGWWGMAYHVINGKETLLLTSDIYSDIELVFRALRGCLPSGTHTVYIKEVYIRSISSLEKEKD